MAGVQHIPSTAHVPRFVSAEPITTFSHDLRRGIPPVLTTTNYNAKNQQFTFGTGTETYDLNGNLATLTDAGGTTAYTWNARNQLASTSGLSLTASFSHDSFGRRIDKTINGTTTNFVYDGPNPVKKGIVRL
jgi:YD repeat-containing protein